MSEDKNWRQCLRRRIWWHGDRWCDKVLDWQEHQPKGWRQTDRLLTVLTPHDNDGWAARWLCRILVAHYPIEDHCGKPEHDFCVFCSQSIPNGAAADRSARLKRAAEIKAAREASGE